MPTILNVLDKTNTVVIGGNHFTFKPGQLKYFHDAGIAAAIDRIKKEEGFIMVPESLDHLAMVSDDMKAKIITEADKELIESKRKEGIDIYCRRLRSLIYNATVSIQKDIDRAGYKYDARVEANSADIERLKELAKYQNQELDQDQRTLEQFKELEAKVAKTSKG
jgi:hypothetical protein